MTAKTMRAAIFDLDGVIVDTAKYHYLAWKRLARELGFDFSEADNERLKGVSRTRSLEILLEIGGLDVSNLTARRWPRERTSGTSSTSATCSPTSSFPERWNTSPSSGAGASRSRLRRPARTRR